MVGKHAGVSTKLRNLVPSLISVHCAAHRLALAASETVSQVFTVNHLKGLINLLFHYLHQPQLPLTFMGLLDLLVDLTSRYKNTVVLFRQYCFSRSTLQHANDHM